jgi:hypothetical protein
MVQTSGGYVMSLDLTATERELLLEILEQHHTSMLRELSHTDTYDYKLFLKQRIDLLEKLKEKVKNLDSSASAA